MGKVQLKNGCYLTIPYMFREKYNLSCNDMVIAGIIFGFSQDGVLVIEDAKSEATRREKDYVLRRKLMKHLIQEQNEVAGREAMRFNEWVSTGKRKKSSEK